jgi:hypothetical protein
MARKSAIQPDRRVTVACRDCGRVLDVFEHYPTRGLIRPPQSPWRPRHVNLTRGARPTRPARAHELGDLVAVFHGAGVWPYHCHRDCGRTALVPVTDAWLNDQRHGARVEV